MYRHFVVRVRHPRNPLKRRWACVCGTASPWAYRLAPITHPHMQITVSRTDLRKPSERVGVQYVQHLPDGTWAVHYKCGHEVHGVDDFDLARSRRSHTVAECQEEGT